MQEKLSFRGGGLILSNARLGRWVINMKIFTLIMCHAHYKCIVVNSIPSQLSNKKIRITGSFTSIQNDKPICVYSNFSLYHFSSSDIISSKIWKSKVLVTFFLINRRQLPLTFKYNSPLWMLAKYFILPKPLANQEFQSSFRIPGCGSYFLEKKSC